MLDRGLLRNEPDKVREASLNKGEPCPIDRWLSLDEERRNLLGRTESLRRRRNELSQEVSSLKKSGSPADSQIAESKKVGDSIGRIDKELSAIDREMNEVELRFTNIPDPDVPVGKDESFNKI
ncbi:MAG: serine--tRNA ligase, partial [Candidatus Aegiribacteria sp.]|nr:serine--tRNA ligase [Candidatus Aegiribacteria sp.]